MNIVDTKSRAKTRVARYSDGSVNFNAYRGLIADFEPVEGIRVEVTITDARSRFGHLDLLVEPRKGTGQKWVERKSLRIYSDPADGMPEEAPVVESTGYEPERSLADSVRDIINQSSSTIK